MLVGPGENAGVIDAGDGIAIAIRIESHNHPRRSSRTRARRPGVGGILRDIFTMGARPLAVMDPLFFGELDDPRQRWLFEGVVSGISSYGNSVGRANGRRRADLRPLLRGQPARQRAVHGRAAGGPACARHRERRRQPLPSCSARRPGATASAACRCSRPRASARSGGADDAKRPSVQVGDPYEEKRLIEACLELLDAGARGRHPGPRGRGARLCDERDRGARGAGMDVDVTAVPRREPGMVARRGHDLGEPGADARDRRRRRDSTRRWRSARSGRSRRASSAA